MNETEKYVAAIVEVGQEKQIYSGQSSLKQAFERELATKGLEAVLWAEGETREKAIQALEQSADLYYATKDFLEQAGLSFR